MLKLALAALRQDIIAATALIASASQLGAVNILLDPKTEDGVVYAVAFLIVAATACCAWKYFLRSRRERFHPSESKTYLTLALAFVVLSLVAAAPAIHRILLVQTTLLVPKDGDRSTPIIIGSLVTELLPSANAATPEVIITAVLDVSRTSVRCTKARDSAVPANEVTEWKDCQQFSVPEADIKRFLFGWNQYSSSSESEARREFERLYWSRTIKPAHRAMLAVPRLAANPVVRNYEFPIRVGLYHEWKQRLFADDLLPTAAEWAKLREESPDLAAALRRYFVEVVGVLGPTFIVSIHNRSAQSVQISSLTYSSKFVQLYKAILLTGYERPKYVLELEDGTHSEPMIPPITVAPNSVATFDLLITLRKPRPGHEFEVSLSVGSSGKPKIAAFPTTNFVFWQGKE